MTTMTPTQRAPETILSGVVYLHASGSWPLALIVLVASVLIPLGKMVALGALLISVQRRSPTNPQQRTQLYRLVELIGRWSMLDVFVDTFVVALVQLQPLMSVAPGDGVVFFMLVVVISPCSQRRVRPAPDLGCDAKAGTPMNEHRPTGPESDALPQAHVVASSHTWPSAIWIIPALAVLIALGIAIDAVLSEGPTVTIVLKSADGVEAGKTFVKYKDVNIGQVTAVQFSDDFEKVEVRAKIARSAAR